MQGQQTYDISLKSFNNNFLQISIKRQKQSIIQIMSNKEKLSPISKNKRFQQAIEKNDIIRPVERAR